jgi:hypothetical protein
MPPLWSKRKVVAPQATQAIDNFSNCQALLTASVRVNSNRATSTTSIQSP